METPIVPRRIRTLVISSRTRTRSCRSTPRSNRIARDHDARLASLTHAEERIVRMRFVSA